MSWPDTYGANSFPSARLLIVGILSILSTVKPLAEIMAIQAFAFVLHLCDDTIGFQSIPGFCSVACPIVFPSHVWEGEELVRMSEIGIDVLIIALLILANGVFAMSEMAVVTARKSRLQDWASKGNTRAKTALELANTPSHFLLAVQIGITLIVILAGALGAGSMLADPVAVYIAFFPSSIPTADHCPWRWLFLASPTFRSSSASWFPSVSLRAIPRQSRPSLPSPSAGFRKYLLR